MVSSCTTGNCGCCPCATSRSLSVWYAGFSACAERQLDGAAAFGARVTRGEADLREVTRARLVERGVGALDFQRLRAQATDSTAGLRVRSRR